ncbi:MAG: orotidine-5'-phosphate decarboxylase [Desulfovibrio sp.]|nr:orotidine-5'-phosphate decarboxylase [Desulfovibrio sp.]
MANLILALDLPDKTKALKLLDEISGDLSWVKVGMELFTRYGPPFLKELSERGLHVFLDLKFYDIPNTVAKAVRSAQKLNIDILTLHCQGGQRMLAGAVEARNGIGGETKTGSPLLFGVTVLTSFADGELPGITASCAEMVKTLASLAAKTGLDGVVCSVAELPVIKEAHPKLLCLCPGIRPSWAPAGDQRRIATPKEAVRKGADFLVIGRPILQAEDPKKALHMILEEIA